MKMQRRSFLKTVGATLAGTLGLGGTKSLPKAVEPIAGPTIAPIELYNLELPDGTVHRYTSFKDTCLFNFRSVQCDYKGRAMFCGKTYVACKVNGNTKNFGAFPPVEEIAKALDAAYA